jgi:hypothetical protein
MHPPFKKPEAIRQGGGAGPARFVITYTRTEDNFNGASWQPDGDGFWVEVARVNGHTVWRLITLVGDSHDNEKAGQ